MLLIACGTGDVTSTSPQLNAQHRGEQFGLSAMMPGRLVACEQRTAAADSAFIGPSGGTLRVGNNELVVPPGAVTEGVMLRGEVPADTVASIRLFPEGLVFRRPAGLALDAAGCANPGEAAKVLYLDDADNVLEEIDAYYDPSWKRVAAPINHFSRYALGV
ncbi:MAG TPA: hypothetical protein VFH14_07070 [Gemmatimonadaceae bacterium]|nr:hypothetical protein [Gemmatimonadaceae bacterium]